MTSETAQTLVGLLSKPELALMRGGLCESIGTDAFAEAINRGFLVPDTETGELCLTSDMTLVEQLRTIAGASDEYVHPLSDAYPKPQLSAGRQYFV